MSVFKETRPTKINSQYAKLYVIIDFWVSVGFQWGGGSYTTFVRPTPVINPLLKDLQLKEFILEAEYEEESSPPAP